MGISEIFIIGIVLAIDAFALTVANCTTYKKTITPLQEWSMPIAFSLFQFAMPVIGYYLGGLVAKQIGSFADYITAGIFFILAGKIIFDIIKDNLKKKNCTEEKNCTTSTAKFTILILLIQAIATSIDAFAVGITFSLKLEISIFIASLIIGVITFILVMVALFFGKYLGKVFEKYAEWVGAGLLLALAIKSLVLAII